MRVVIAGGSGFLGRALASALAARGDSVVILSRHAGSTPAAKLVGWVPDGGAGPWSNELAGADVVVNLAGAGIADKRWSKARKDVLRSSRVKTTRSLVSGLRAIDAVRRPPVFIQGSAIGFYGTPGDQILDESSPPGSDFLGTLTVDWETEARAVEALDVRLVLARSGIVLARTGGALGKMLMPFRFFVGGPIATGRQYFSWVHIDDWIACVLWAIATPSVSGAINVTAPQPVTNQEFSAAAGRALHRPNWLAVPAPALRVLVGPMANDALVRGQRAVPARALALGFTFTYPAIDTALASLTR